MAATNIHIDQRIIDYIKNSTDVLLKNGVYIYQKAEQFGTVSTYSDWGENTYRKAYENEWVHTDPDNIIDAVAYDVDKPMPRLRGSNEDPK